MKKDMFVTAGLCLIKDKIAQSAEEPAEKSADVDGTLPDHPVSVFEGLPAETAKALRSRWQEYEHFRQDLNIRLHEIAARIANQCAELEKNSADLQKMKEETAKLLERLEKQPELDEYAPDFQLRLSDNYRQLEHLRIDLADIQLPTAEKTAVNQSAKNLFAELDSVTFGQMFRLGAAFMLPLILAVLFSGLLLILAIFLTFRVNL
jgi:DNA repair ATPase RecN